MNIGNRRIGVVLSAFFQKRHYRAASNMLRVYHHPIDAFARYFFGRGRYPSDLQLHTVSGPLTITVYSYHDILTVNEVFCRVDYPVRPTDRVIVDFGSNIGISAAYFLASAPLATAYLYEPLPLNTERLHRNLRPFAGRYRLHEIAVGPTAGNVEFGWEETGRYGGIGLATGRSLSVPCRDSNAVLTEILDRHGRIDILKIDIENLEREVTGRIPDEIARRIDRIYVEYAFSTNPLARTHRVRQYGAVAHFTALDFPAAAP